MSRYTYTHFEYFPPPGLTGTEPRHQVAVIGAGPIGLAIAIDLALKGIATVVLDDNDVVSVGSRAICWGKRTLEIFDRLGVGERMLEKGVVWKIGRVFDRHDEIWNFNLLPEEGHRYPAFVNLQQYYVEQFLVERARDFPELIDLRFKNNVVGHTDHGDHVTLDIDTPGGRYNINADYMLACDGAGSPTRNRMGLKFIGQSFEDHFLIVDVEMQDSPFNSDKPERWFWFNPPFHEGQSALLHQQPDGIFRLDLQLNPDTDPETAATEENILPRIKAIMGDKPFKLDWMSVYKFKCSKLDEFIHGRVIFLGDSAHVVSPFGARGGNGGIHDVDNLGWKLAAVLKGDADPALLSSYQIERKKGADENILNSTRTTNFMTPKSAMEMTFRNEVLTLASEMPFAQRLINSGRLSVPCELSSSPLNSTSEGPLQAGVCAYDAPLEGKDWLINHIQGQTVLLGIGDIDIPDIDGVKRIGINQENKAYACYHAANDMLTARYGNNILYLIRPDGHIAASFTDADPDRIRSTYKRMLSHDQK
jgi:3-(3-hydroxy-phenyl)propionate hydroxylase